MLFTSELFQTSDAVVRVGAFVIIIEVVLVNAVAVVDVVIFVTAFQYCNRFHLPLL